MRFFLMFENYLWTNGTPGYDGRIDTWDREGYGELGCYREQIQFNSEGLLQFDRVYIRIGSGWRLVYSCNLLTEGESDHGITGFELIFVIFAFLTLQIILTWSRAFKKERLF